MISWPPRLRRLDPFKTQFSEIEQIDKCVNHSNRIVLLDPVVQAFRKQCRLFAISPLNEALHSIPRDPQWIISCGRFHTPKVSRVDSSAPAMRPVYLRLPTEAEAGWAAVQCHE